MRLIDTPPGSRPTGIAFVALLAVAPWTTGCYAYQNIPLAKLDDLTAAPGRVPRAELDGEACEGCRVEVDTTTPLILTTTQGEALRVTPFYFHLSKTQLVAPDYGVLVERDEIGSAAVRTISVGRTVALVSTVVLIAAGTFAAIQLTAGTQSLRAK